jgi:hypothetical protein
LGPAPQRRTFARQLAAPAQQQISGARIAARLSACADTFHVRFPSQENAQHGAANSSTQSIETRIRKKVGTLIESLANSMRDFIDGSGG